MLTKRLTAMLGLAAVLLSCARPASTGADTVTDRPFAALKGSRLTITNGAYVRAWHLGPGRITSADSPGDSPEATSAWTWKISQTFQRDLPVSAEALVVTLEGRSAERKVGYRFRSFPAVPAVELTRLAPAGTEVACDAAIDAIHIAHAERWRFAAVYLQDGTDGHGKARNLVQTVVHELTNGAFQEKANIAYLENKQDGTGTIFVKLAPLPHARAIKIDHDFAWDGKTLGWYGPGINPVSGQGYACATIAYEGGRAGRIAALQDYYRCLRQYKPGRDGLIVSNTWGDRHRDSKISESFLLKEIKAGHALGVDVMQIDDGWQKGASKNSSAVTRSNTGVWSGFWKADPSFWTPHPRRLPHGLAPLAKAAKSCGMHLGLWYAPDSEHEFANWKRDADHLLQLHQAFGVDYFKLDSITMTTPTAEHHVQQMLDRIIRESGGDIVTDLDVTASVRPGYLGAVAAGPVFVENRYTDWGNYWPHQTLRNFWSLAEYVDPVRLRMEFLNNTRATRKYKNHPLAPATYPPAYLFASVMFGSPLAWFEVSELPPSYANEVRGLIAVWKKHRSRIHSGHIIPIGNEPDGHQWTGFVSIARDGQSGYAVILREVNEISQWRMRIPLLQNNPVRVEVLSGTGTASVSNRTLHLSIPQPRGYLFLRFQAHGDRVRSRGAASRISRRVGDSDSRAR